MKEKKRKKRSCYSLCLHDCKHINWCSAFTVFILWWAVLLNLYKHTHTHWSYFQLSLSSWGSPAKSVDAEVDWVTCERRTPLSQTFRSASTHWAETPTTLHRHLRGWRELTIKTQPGTVHCAWCVWLTAVVFHNLTSPGTTCWFQQSETRARMCGMIWRTLEYKLWCFLTYMNRK